MNFKADRLVRIQTPERDLHRRLYLILPLNRNIRVHGITGVDGSLPEMVVIRHSDSSTVVVIFSIELPVVEADAVLSCR